ncbi:MAG: nucleotide exchange factor GrpE [Gammaproteobacteria bacterium]|nr:nucleotide exchange factor GrpE [Gammaproteobacteria bacterium]
MNAERPEKPLDDVGEEVPAEEAAQDDVTDDAAAAAEPEDELAAATAKAEENWNRYLRTAAELENVRKRAARDVESAHKFALERFGKELLAVRDTLEIGLAAAEGASVESLIEGKNATLKLLTSTFNRFGIEEVDPAGEPFDPELHAAISMQPSDDVEPGSVVTVVQKGYTLNGRLLRPAMVIVAAD